MRQIFVIFTMIFLVVACSRGPHPILSVENHPVYTASGGTVALAQVRKAIIKGAVSKGWAVKDIDSNTIVAKVGTRAIEAVVTIKFTARQYSILYRDSSRLSYGSGKIHPRYNTWVTKLRNEIDAELAGL